MKFERLKSLLVCDPCEDQRECLAKDHYLKEYLYKLAPEILVLVDAYRVHEGDDEVTRDIAVGMAYDAFNAKLESL